MWRCSRNHLKHSHILIFPQFHIGDLFEENSRKYIKSSHMKKKSIHIISLLVFVAVAILIVARYYNKQAKGYELLARKGASAETREWRVMSNYASSLVKSIRK